MAPAFSHAWMSAVPAVLHHQHAVKDHTQLSCQYIRGTETFFPSIVSSTSAWRFEVVANVRAARLPLRATSAGDRGSARNRWDRIVIAGLTVVLW